MQTVFRDFNTEESNFSLQAHAGNQRGMSDGMPDSYCLTPANGGV